MDEMNRDLLFLSDEKFDFDVSLSPASSRGDEDEDEDRCVSVTVASQPQNGGGVFDGWSPLTGAQLDAMCQEAHRVADQLQSNRTSPPPGRVVADVAADVAADGENFVQDTDAKLGLLGQPAAVLSPIKRQTFCVQDSPLKELPPAIQRRLQRGNAPAAAPSARPVVTAARAVPTQSSSTRPAASSSDTRTRMALRGRPMAGGVLPSKLAVPSTSCSASKSKEEGARLRPPSKTASWRRSPSPLLPTCVESNDDPHSDSGSVTSDLSDSSLNASVAGKSSLVPPAKTMRNLSGVKAPPPQSRRVMERKSSSSSSVSRQSVSPPPGKLNSSMNRRLSGCGVAPPGSVSRPVDRTGPRRSIAHDASAGPQGAAPRRSLSVTQNRKQPEAARATPLKRAAATPLQATPAAKRASERIASARQPGGSKVLAPPTPSGRVKTLHHGNGVSSPDVSKTLKLKKLTSVGSVDSLAPLTPSAGGGRSLQALTRRPSAIPTPLRRRVSSVPVATPTTRTCPARPLPTSDSSSSDGTDSSSPAPTDTPEPEPGHALDIQPFCLEEEDPPVALPPTAPQIDQSESRNSQSKSEPQRNLIELETTEEKKNQELLLLDLPPPVLQPKEKLLIDLTNTPEPIQTCRKTGTATQLIDLSSPLIKWSPEDKKENVSQLINLSF